VAKDIKSNESFWRIEVGWRVTINKHQIDIDEKRTSKEKVTRKLTIDGYF
jgi:hypothetical protein